MEMCKELKDKLLSKGWNLEKVIWGERVSGSPNHILLKLPNGRVSTFFGPFVSIRAGYGKDGIDQSAIVQFG